MTKGYHEDARCKGCGIPLTDGYVIGCTVCSNRRTLRLKRGNLFTFTGIAGEAIDNLDVRGRIVAA